jgi:hypothetical protein
MGIERLQFESVEAERRWEMIAPENKMRLLNTVWCSHCCGTRSIGRVHGEIVGPCLVLSGICTTCGEKIARVLEGE